MKDKDHGNCERSFIHKDEIIYIVPLLESIMLNIILLPFMPRDAFEWIQSDINELLGNQ